ncbi:MAG: hypothetical protein NWQ09_00905 [Nonlabens sp.]|nr:hypothetical protein [Nonlabens sp.]MDP5099858.1 hypothetical protein [Nonlabens sp.]
MLTDLLGTIGVFMILLAYLLNITGKLETTRLRFILLNLIGSSLACAASLLLHYLPFIILEGVWALVSFVALVKYLRTA